MGCDNVYLIIGFVGSPQLLVPGQFSFQESTVNVYTVCSRGTRALRRLVEECQEELSPEEIPDEVLLRTAYDGLKAFRSAEREDVTC